MIAQSSVTIDVAGLDPAFVPYGDGLDLQRQAADRLDSGADDGTLILLEHEPVYTAGRRADPAEYPTDGSPVVPVDRGGLVTWHGPGQLVGYPVIRISPDRGVVDVVRALEGVLLDVSAEFGVTGHRVAGRSGVWATAGASEVKFAQIGLRARAHVITHGFALNCSNALEPFSSFIPCGITDAGAASLSTLAGTEITPADVLPVITPRLLDAIAELTS
ncbi:lipoyl(octanoyl) transferase LipB [Leucobacter tardus]|uniref:Octanoyltransferase n=1 Tax=Leucobacter tardus TaxID=501483 RepID=A0A939QE36_9MICO|nr:lipoyl(octanoyl) transferase LipB [Leucobacter tardus]MBO2990455.1 lipoyl(octanoyl) transferase LipB [Leucobacter tardus]